MRRSDNRVALTDEVARFQAEVQRLARAAARAIVRQELDRRLAKLKPTRTRVERPSRAAATVASEPPGPALPGSAVPASTTATTATAATAASATRAASAAPAASPGPTVEPPAEAPAAATPREQPPDRPGRRKRIPWTREAIINELATWMLSGTAIDATFVTRHGPPGLVAATRRVFGRFEAALNVAGLHVSKLYPDGPPTR